VFLFVIHAVLIFRVTVLVNVRVTFVPAVAISMAVFNDIPRAMSVINICDGNE
jgi:hypothetical protein